MKLLKTIFFLLLTATQSFANNDFFNQGLALYQKDDLKKAKFKFEQDLVLNPKNERSYLYLSKIFNVQKKKKLEEQNLNTVILLNPENEEAIYYLSELMLDKSDYKESERLVNQLLNSCKNFCQQSKNLKIKIENSQKK